MDCKDWLTANKISLAKIRKKFYEIKRERNYSNLIKGPTLKTNFLSIVPPCHVYMGL